MSDTTPKQSSGLAVAGLVLGILAAVGSFLPIINNLSAILAVIGGVLAVIALIGANRGKHQAKGMSIAGIVLAVVSFAIVLATQSMYKAALDAAVKDVESGEKPAATTSAPSSSDTKKEETKKEEPKQEEKQEQKTEEKKAEEPAADYSNMATGETVTLENGLAITVNSFARVTQTYGDEELVCANVTYANNSSETLSFNLLDWKSEDDNGVQKSVSYNIGDDNQLDSGQLKAGGTVTGNVYFDGATTKVLYFSNIFQKDSEIGWVVS